MDTYFGHTAKLVASVGAVSHFQKAVLHIGNYLIYLSLGLVSILVVAQIVRHASMIELFQFALILTVASIPVAMPAVLSVTMAVGALALSKMKAIVARLESIEEMAGIDILPLLQFSPIPRFLILAVMTRLELDSSPSARDSSRPHILCHVCAALEPWKGLMGEGSEYSCSDPSGPCP